MNQTLATQSTAPAKIEAALIIGDLSKLTDTERINYYNSVCNSLGLNPLTKPFDYITLNGKLTLYARKDATEQLRSIHGISIQIAARDLVNDVFVVTAQATTKEGRADESVGAVNVKGLQGDSLANAYMRAETKAKRRVTLSICGLGMLDETEVETIPVSDKKPAPIPTAAPTPRATPAPALPDPKPATGQPWAQGAQPSTSTAKPDLKATALESSLKNQLSIDTLVSAWKRVQEAKDDKQITQVEYNHLAGVKNTVKANLESVKGGA